MMVNGSAPALGFGLCFLFFLREGRLTRPSVVITSLSLSHFSQMASRRMGPSPLHWFCHLLKRVTGSSQLSLLSSFNRMKNTLTNSPPYPHTHSFSCKLTTWQSVQLNLVSLAPDHIDWRHSAFLLFILPPRTFPLTQKFCPSAHQEGRHSASEHTAETLGWKKVMQNSHRKRSFFPPLYRFVNPKEMSGLPQHLLVWDVATCVTHIRPDSLEFILDFTKDFLAVLDGSFEIYC